MSCDGVPNSSILGFEIDSKLAVNMMFIILKLLADNNKPFSEIISLPQKPTMKHVSNNTPKSTNYSNTAKYRVTII